MTSIRRFSRWALVAGLAFLQTPSWAAAPAGAKTDPGFEMSIMESTQFNFGKLSIGAGYMGGGAYLDEKGVRRDGLHVTLSITIAGEPAQFQQPDISEGQTLNVSGYRILVEKIIPQSGPNDRRGFVIVRVWGRQKRGGE
ncbi:MAG: hypothetical protein KGI68_02950 [Alphaproteobacteria bacterium]|nr:hypothetical protein [Alphaproteobacteria bacterium]